MRTSTGLFIASAVLAGFTTLFGWLYNTKPHIPEAELLRTTATYAKQYKGDNLNHVLEMMDETLDAVGGNENVSQEQVSELETGLSELQESITESTPKSLYGPAIRAYADKMEDAHMELSRDRGYVALCVLSGVCTVGIAGIGIRERVDNYD